MAKTKKELLAQLEGLGVEVNPKSTIAELTELIAANQAVDAPGTADVDEATDVNDEAAEAAAETKTAKAGKRSAKALAEAEAKEAKEERKASGEVAEAKPKAPAKPARPRLERRGKHFRKSAEKLEKGKVYNLEQAVGLAKQTSHVKFDATVEMHINLGVDPRHADQNIRDNLVLPAGTG
ncbi:MAG TPA: 50S ribosomal protein L1, partial [Candidatus Saccharimonadales bacterium]